MDRASWWRKSRERRPSDYRGGGERLVRKEREPRARRDARPGARSDSGMLIDERHDAARERFLAK